MSEENVAVVRGLFEQWGTDYWRDAIAEDVVWDNSGTSYPSAGVYHGHDGVQSFFAAWLGAWEDPEVELLEIRGAGSLVYAGFRWRGRGRASGVKVENDFYGVYELKDGAIVHFRQFETREEALRVAGLSP